TWRLCNRSVRLWYGALAAARRALAPAARERPVDGIYRRLRGLGDRAPGRRSGLLGASRRTVEAPADATTDGRLSPRARRLGDRALSLPAVRFARRRAVGAAGRGAGHGGILRDLLRL